jgi:hypothetical protein
VAAAEVYRFGGETEWAEACLSDAVSLYPGSGPAAQARKQLSPDNQESLNHEKKPESN